ncbi:Lipid carrier : UDP-N-acetylgalactosaminyltransferase [hydrothermal vent metagenome]|uniref:Lipid carrier: UDP-N-acetylgalactosaminyltransferase n=1 Tax=hydrothermal vent metagenome TaxID=652676 RepID=A0A1W1EKN8_9ZZZZ
MYKTFGKRLFDIISSFIGVILLSPIFIIISILIKLDSKGDIFYTQIRITKDFKPFKLFKFRSMRQDSSGLSITSRDDNRITKIGKFIRKTKIDELPQLLNVLIGDMSLVGPRPEVSKYVEIKRDEYKKVLSVKAGITDNSAIEFRDEEEILASYDDKEKAYIDIILPQKIELYNKYIDNINFKNDIILILKTIKVL